MRLVLFLTFVLLSTLALASPDSTITPSKIDSGPKSPWLNEGEALIQSRANTPHSLTGYLGSMMGPLVDKGQSRSSLFLGIDQTNQNHNFTGQNYGVQLTEIGMVGVHWAFRTIMALSKDYEPYYEWGVGALYKPQEYLASIVNYERYQARLGAGFEDFLNMKRQLRLGGEIAYGVLGLTFIVQTGYTFSD